MGNLVSATKRRKASRKPAKNDRITGEDSEGSGSECTILVLGKERVLPPTLVARLKEIVVDAGLDKSEKSAAVKQMKIIHQNGFSEAERATYRTAIYQNLLESAQVIVFTMHKLCITAADVQTRV